MTNPNEMTQMSNVYLGDKKNDCLKKHKCKHAFDVKIWIVEFRFELNYAFDEVFKLLELKSIKT